MRKKIQPNLPKEGKNEGVGAACRREETEKKRWKTENAQ